jgi:hypothetical protein
MRQPLSRQQPHFVEPLELLTWAFSCNQHSKVCNTYQDKSYVNPLIDVFISPSPRDWLLRFLETIDIKALTTRYFSGEWFSAECHSLAAISAQTYASFLCGTLMYDFCGILFDCR